jgi:hypothetical protein
VPRSAINLDERRHLPLPERMILMEADQASHVDECTARWNLLIQLLMWGGGGVAGTVTVILISVVGWSFNTLHQDQERQNALFQQYIQTPPRVTITPSR